MKFSKDDFYNIIILQIFLVKKCHTAKFRGVDTLNIALFGSNTSQLLLNHRSDLFNNVQGS